MKPARVACNQHGPDGRLSDEDVGLEDNLSSLCAEYYQEEARDGLVKKSVTSDVA